MPENLPSLDLLAGEVRTEREAQLRHADAVDAKAGIVLGFSGALVAVSATRLTAWRVPGLVAALVAAVLAMMVFTPRRYPTWRLEELRDRFLRAEPVFTKLNLLDTQIAMIERQRAVIERGARLLRWAIRGLAGATILLVGGTIMALLGG